MVNLRIFTAKDLKLKVLLKYYNKNKILIKMMKMDFKNQNYILYF